MRWTTAFAGVVLATLAAAGCSSNAPVKQAWSHYDDCLAGSASFRDFAECGKRSRVAYCAQLEDGCSKSGDMVVAYADSLVRSVTAREFSEAEAQRRWIDFRNKKEDAFKQREATIAAGEDVADAVRQSAPLPRR